MNSRERILKAFKILPGLPERIPVHFQMFGCLSLSLGILYTSSPNKTRHNTVQLGYGTLLTRLKSWDRCWVLMS